METKKCTKCKKIKIISEFYKDNSQKSGLTTRCKQCYQIYRDQHKEKQRLYMHNLRENNREEINKRKRNDWQKMNPLVRVYRQAKNRAKRKGIEFTITLKDLFLPIICPLLELPLVAGTKDFYEQTHSLDRIDPTKGYIPGNVWIISMRANTMKNNATKEELLKFSLNIIKKFGDNDIVRTMWKHIESKDKKL